MSIALPRLLAGALHFSGGWGGGLDRRWHSPPRGRWGELQPSREQGALPRARAQRRTRLLVFI